MKPTYLLATLMLVLAPALSTEARIVKPEIQFQTLEEIQAAARAEIQNGEVTLTPDQARQQRLLQLTRASNTGVNRVKSAKENFKKRIGRTRSSAAGNISKTRVPRRASALRSLSNAQAQAPSSTEVKPLSIQDRLRARLNRLKGQKQTDAKTQLDSNSKSNRRSSFEFVPQEEQIWGR